MVIALCHLSLNLPANSLLAYQLADLTQGLRSGSPGFEGMH